MIAINLRGVTKHYGAFKAIDDLNISIDKGEVVGFVGLNGAGKSTTINILLGFIKASVGEVEVLGEKIRPSTAHLVHSKIGYASGDMALFTNLSGRQYLDFLAGRLGLSSATYQTRLTELSGVFLPDLDKKIKTLSRGNRQKIALMGAFLDSPELVILDEPTSGLDPLMQQNFLELVKAEAARGVTVFMSSHYLTEVVDVCSRVLLIKKGRIIKDLSASELVRGSGKRVRLVTKAAVKSPGKVENIEHHKVANGLEIKFVYKGQIDTLMRWLGGLKGVVDFEVSDHDTETAFAELYGDDQIQEVDDDIDRIAEQLEHEE